MRDTLPGRLAIGLQRSQQGSADAEAYLAVVAARAAAAEDLDVEMAALAELTLTAWRRGRVEAVGKSIPRILELEALRRPASKELSALVRAISADLVGDDSAVVEELTTSDWPCVRLAWRQAAAWLLGSAHLSLGRPDRAEEVVELFEAASDPSSKHLLDLLRLRAWWAQGRVDEVVAKLPSKLDALPQARAFAGFVLSHVGRVGHGENCLADASRANTGDTDVETAVATSALRLARGDEAQSAAILRRADELHGLDQGGDRGAWRQALSLSYVLLPEVRSYWDETADGDLRIAVDLAAAVVAVREVGGAKAVAHLDLPDLDRVRALLHHRFAAELAVALTTARRPEGRALLDALGPSGRAAVQDLAGRESVNAKLARDLLAAVPALPPYETYLGVLGPLVQRRGGPGGVDDTHAYLRRKQEQRLLAFLVTHRTTTRARVAETLWPDSSEKDAANSRNVLLHNLLAALEPWQARREPHYLIQTDGDSLRLHLDRFLRLDIDEFDDHAAAADRAESERMPSLALEHHLAAVELYRDDLFVEIPEEDWFALDREHYRVRFVGAAVRAGQLLLARGSWEGAADVARRALAVDQWAEEAHTVLVGASLARGDRSGAARQLSRCLTALADLGLEPSAATQQLRRRISGL